MNLIILVCAVLSANTILGFVAGLIGRFLPKKWWIEWLCKIPGLGAGLLYLYFAGYYIMDKEANLFLACRNCTNPAGDQSDRENRDQGQPDGRIREE